MSQHVPLPEGIIPFILQNLAGFAVVLETNDAGEGERIILAPRNGLAATLATFTPATGAVAPPVRKFTYHVVNAKLTPAQAKKKFDLSPLRFNVYRAVFNKPGIGASEMLQELEMPKGTLQTTLNWLRKQKLVTGSPEAAS